MIRKEEYMNGIIQTNITMENNSHDGMTNYKILFKLQKPGLRPKFSAILTILKVYDTRKNSTWCVQDSQHRKEDVIVKLQVYINWALDNTSMPVLWLSRAFTVI
jgi:hypothetical protein